MGTNSDIIKREFDRAKFTKIFNEKFLKKKALVKDKFSKSAYKMLMADYTKMDPSTVKDWFSRHSPLPSTLDKIAEFLEVSVDDITIPVFLSQSGNKSMTNKKMIEFGITEAKTYKIIEYTLWNGLKVFLKHRVDTPKNELYTLYLEDFCLCDISPENAENENRLINILIDVIDDDCILDYTDIASVACSSKFFPEPELLLRANKDKLIQRFKEDEEYCRNHNIDIDNIKNLDSMKDEFLKHTDIK